MDEQKMYQNRKIRIFNLLLISLIILIPSAVHAVSTGTLVTYYQYDNDYLDANKDNDQFASGSGNTFTTTKKLGTYALSLTGSGFAKNLTPKGIPLGDSSWSATFWMYPTDVPNVDDEFNYIMSWGSTSGWNQQNSIALKYTATGSCVRLVTLDPTSGWISSDCLTVSNNNWYFGTIAYSSADSRTYYYLDNVLKGNVSTANNNVVNGQIKVGIEWQFDIASGYKGYLDGIGLWNKTLTTTEIAELYNSGTGLDYPFTPPEASSITLSTDMVEGANFTLSPILYNFTGSTTGTNTTYDCDLYVNGTWNQTKNNLVIIVENNFTFNPSQQETGYQLRINCTNSDATATLTRNIFIDAVKPRITTTLTNLTEYEILDYIEINATYTDTNLYAVNYTIKDMNGNLVDNEFSEGTASSVTITSARYADDYGLYTVRLQAWDSHTANKVTPLKWYYDPVYMAMKLDDDIILSGDIKYFKDDTAITYLYASGDRYKLKVTFQEDLDTQYMTIRTIKKDRLRFLPDSGYKGHFVYWGDTTWRWIDFEGKNVESVDVTRVNADEYDLAIHLITPSDELELESIGDLNYVEAVYYYSVVNAPAQETTTQLNEIQGELDMIAEVILIGIVLATNHFLVRKASKIISDIFLMAVGFGVIMISTTATFSMSGYIIGIFGFLMFMLDLFGPAKMPKRSRRGW